MNTFSKTVAYKFNTGKPGAFLHTNIKLTEKDTKKAALFTIA